MAAVEECSALLLAAGLSRRFGDDDKLMSRYRGQPLIAHAARTLMDMPLVRKVAVVRDDRGAVADLLGRLGFDLVVNAQPERGLASSVRAGIESLHEAGPVLIALGDMPLVPGSHFEALCTALSPDDPTAASHGLGKPTVPAAFAPAAFPALLDLTGDMGAKNLLAGAAHVPIASGLLVDIDHPADLERQA